MRRMAGFLAIILGGILVFSAAAPASAQERPDIWRYTNREGKPLPFPRSERAQSVWNGGACWSDCGAHCAWAMAGCLKYDEQGTCLVLTDVCDRYCQTKCRTAGGPLIPYVDLPIIDYPAK